MRQFSVPVLAFRSAGLPAVSSVGESKIYFDSSAGMLMVSNDGGEWLPLGEGQINTLLLEVTLDGYQISANVPSLNFSSAFAVTAEDGYVSVDIAPAAELHSLLTDTAINGHPASIIDCNTAQFDGYVLSGTDADVQTALVTIGNEIGRYSTIHDVAYSAIVNIDFAGSKLLEIDQLTGNLELTTLNLTRGQGVTVRFSADGTNRTLTLPAWNFFGSAAPTQITANKTGVLSLLSWGTTDGEVDAGWVESV